MIRLVNRTRGKLPEALLKRAARAAVGSHDVTIAVVDAHEMARLNWRFLRHQGPTDVLAFPSGDKETLGEIAVCPAVARREAKARGIPWEQELARYVVHGCLHLLGYDDHAPAARKRMWARQEEILGRLSGF